MMPPSQENACCSPIAVLLVPTTCPVVDKPLGPLQHPPNVPMSCRVPPSQNTLCPLWSVPATCARSLRRDGKKLPRSVITPSSHRNACCGQFQYLEPVLLKPTTCPRMLIATASLPRQLVLSGGAREPRSTSS